MQRRMQRRCFLLNTIKFRIKLQYHELMAIYCSRIRLKFHCAQMASKETPKKVYRSLDSDIDLSSCRLCGAVGDPSHRKNLFKRSNQALLRIAEQLCGYPLVQDSSLPHLVCRPCERRLNNCLQLQEVIKKTEEIFQQRLTRSTRVKRCVNVSPSISQPQKSRISASKRRVVTSLSFDVGQERSSLNPDIEVISHSYLLLNIAIVY